mmetsp:Transcript_11033/g.37487  ORF Transcript_11033/g.37487 Transcript_11033/m.37487 type:complete len:261 (-) Transcript_11033:229-1011(-)
MSPSGLTHKGHVVCVSSELLKVFKGPPDRLRDVLHHVGDPPLGEVPVIRSHEDNSVILKHQPHQECPCLVPDDPGPPRDEDDNRSPSAGVSLVIGGEVDVELVPDGGAVHEVLAHSRTPQVADEGGEQRREHDDDKQKQKPKVGRPLPRSPEPPEKLGRGRREQLEGLVEADIWSDGTESCLEELPRHLSTERSLMSDKVHKAASESISSTLEHHIYPRMSVGRISSFLSSFHSLSLNFIEFDFSNISNQHKLSQDHQGE